MIKSIITILLITLISTFRVPQVQPVALDLMLSHYDNLLIFIYQQQDKEAFQLFQSQASQLNSTYPDEKTLYAICNASKDTSKKLSRYGSAGIKLINKVIHFELGLDRLNHLIRFYLAHTRPPLPIILPQQLKQITSPTILLLQYNNQTTMLAFQSLNHKIFKYSQSFNLLIYAMEVNQNQTASITLRKLQDGITTEQEYMNQLNDITSVVQFMNVESLPPVSQLNDNTFYRTYGSHIDKQILLVYRNATSVHHVKEQFKKAAIRNIKEDLKSQRVLFCEIEQGLVNEYFEQGLIELNTSDYKIVMTHTDFAQYKITRYEYKGQPLQNDIINFVHDVQMKKINPSYKSQKQPTQQGKIRKIVGSTFISQIFENKQLSVLVLFIDSKDPKSYKKILKVFQEFGDKYKEAFKGKLMLGIFDLAKNQHQLLSIKEAPQFVLFERRNKKKPKIFKGQVKIDTLRGWVNYQVQDLTIPQNYGQAPLPLGPSEL